MASKISSCSFGPYESPKDAECFLAIERCKGHYFWRRILVPEEERSPYGTLARVEREYHELVDKKLSGHEELGIDERLQKLALMLDSFCPDFAQQNERAVQLREEEETKYRDITEIRKTIEEVARKVESYERRHGEGSPFSGT